MKRELKICMVSNTYYPYVGGIAEHIFNLSDNLRALGHTVKILTTHGNGRMLTTDTLTHDEQFIYRIGNGIIIRANKSFAQMPIGWRLSDKVEQFFQKENFDVIHIHGALAPTLPTLALRHSRTINLITYHSGHPKDYKYLLAHSILLSYHRKLHGRIAVSDTALNSNLHLFPAECRVIPNGIDTRLFNPQVRPLEKFSDNRPKILFLARFEPRKGLKYLLQALPIIKKAIPNVLLIIVGQGLLGYTYQNYIAKEVKDNIHFAGLITGDKRARYYASCDVFCAPSIGNESFGIVLLEAMATGKPVVASNIPGYRSILENGKTGLLTQSRNPKDIADKIIQILTNAELSRRTGEVGRHTAQEYSWDKITKLVEEYYYDLIMRFPQIHNDTSKCVTC
ncbi:MAG: glycosyltransferase family 4 protein [Candidatus Latescibacteria bacterium]|nr:glycosyltransferase family 4 protein [Candidatus Latescibacterota bacterium]